MQLKLLVLVAVLLVVWLYIRRRGQTRNDEEQAPVKRVEDTRYHAVSIKFGKDACAAAKGLTGERFLATEAPELPLRQCDAGVCECRFTHHEDRRTGRDRRDPFGPGYLGGGTGRFDAERREGSERRKNDQTDPF